MILYSLPSSVLPQTEKQYLTLIDLTKDSCFSYYPSVRGVRLQSMIFDNFFTMVGFFSVLPFCFWWIAGRLGSTSGLCFLRYGPSLSFLIPNRSKTYSPSANDDKALIRKMRTNKAKLSPFFCSFSVSEAGFEVNDNLNFPFPQCFWEIFQAYLFHFMPLFVNLNASNSPQSWVSYTLN